MGVHTRLLFAVVVSVVMHAAVCLPGGVSGVQAQLVTGQRLNASIGSVSPPSDHSIESSVPFGEVAIAEGKESPQDSASPKDGGGDVGREIYLKPSDLDALPEPIGDYPRITTLGREQLAAGHVVIEVWLSPSGVVLRAERVESALPQYVVDDILEKIANQRFLPGRVEGKPVFARFRLEFEYLPPDEDGHSLR